MAILYDDIYWSERTNNFKNVKRRAEWLFKQFVDGDAMIESIQKDYLAGMTKEQLIVKFFPDQKNKSKHVNEMFIDKILEGIDEEERQKRYKKTYENLDNTDSQKQSERGKKGWLLKQLSSQQAKVMNQATITTLEQRAFIMTQRSTLSGTRDQVNAQIAELFLQKFGEPKSPGAIRGIIQREQKKQQSKG